MSACPRGIAGARQACPAPALISAAKGGRGYLKPSCQLLLRQPIFLKQDLQDYALLHAYPEPAELIARIFGSSKLKALFMAMVDQYIDPFG
jgi:hypothetical protein